MSKQAKKKSSARVIILALGIYMLIFGGIILYFSGNFDRVLSFFTPSDQVEDKVSVNLESVQYSIEEQLQMDEGKSDAELVAEVDYLIDQFFEDEAQKTIKAGDNEVLLGWLAVKSAQIKDPVKKREAEDQTLNITLLNIHVNTIAMYFEEESMLEHITSEELDHYNDTVAYLNSRNPAYGKIAKKESEKLQKAFEGRLDGK